MRNRIRYKAVLLSMIAVTLPLAFLVSADAQETEHRCDVDDWNEADACDEYGGFFNSHAEGAGFNVFPGYGGSVTLSLRRPDVDCTNGGSVVYSPRGSALTADTLDKEIVINMNAVGSSIPWTMRDPFSMFEIEGWEPLRPDPRTWVPEIPMNSRLEYRDLYPGVDFSYYEDQNRWEYVYAVRPGAVWSNMSMVLDTDDHHELDSHNDLVFYFECGKLVKHKPIIYQISEEGEVHKQRGSFSLNGGGFGFDFEPEPSDLEKKQQKDEYSEDPELCLVSGSGDTNGTPYDFHMAKYETSNSKYIDFLNHAQLHREEAYGSNMWFDARGNVWFNPEMKDQRDELFSIANSRIRYKQERDVGERYFLTSKTPMIGGSYSNHPVTGVSWFGAVKYCNWLTLKTGRDIDQLAYTEGTNSFDWHPVTCATTNWIEGKFLNSERVAWLSRDGFRLPMDNGTYTNNASGFFNEFHKAATWLGNTNAVYGYGKEKILQTDANYFLRNAFLKRDTMPTGFYDGTDHDGLYPTGTNENLYGIYDLSGNVNEWVNDHGVTNSSLTRAYYGGSWKERLPEVTERRYARPHLTETGIGFRVVTRSCVEEMLVIRVPFHICLCGGCRGMEEEPEEEPVDVAAKEPEPAEEEITVLTIDPADTGIPDGLTVIDDDDDPIEPPIETDNDD